MLPPTTPCLCPIMSPPPSLEHYNSPLHSSTLTSAHITRNIYSASRKLIHIADPYTHMFHTANAYRKGHVSTSKIIAASGLTSVHCITKRLINLWYSYFTTHRTSNPHNTGAIEHSCFSWNLNTISLIRGTVTARKENGRSCLPYLYKSYISIQWLLLLTREPDRCCTYELQCAWRSVRLATKYKHQILILASFENKPARLLALRDFEIGYQRLAYLILPVSRCTQHR